MATSSLAEDPKSKEPYLAGLLGTVMGELVLELGAERPANNELPHEKTSILHMQKQRRRLASR